MVTASLATMDREGGVVVYGGRFRAVAYVARRPWATVFRAIDEQDGSVVALSVVSPGAAPGDDFGGLLTEEVGLLDGLVHPNLLPVLAHGQDQGAHYLAEEWVEGPTLAEVVAARGPLPADRVAAVMDDLADGLAAAHAAGVVHGGPAPADVWLVGGPGGVARLHGLALLRAVVLGSVEAGLPPAGDRPYLAPERLAGEVGAPAADLYGLGALCFEAMCGVPPFGRDGRAEGEDPPWPSDLVEGIPEGFDDVVLDLLEAEPADRYHDALELREELAPFLAGPGRSRGPRAAAAGAGASVAALATAEAAGDLRPSTSGAGEPPDEEVGWDPAPDGEAEEAEGVPIDGVELEGSDAALLVPDHGLGSGDPAGVGELDAEHEGEADEWEDGQDWEDGWEPLEAEWEPDPAVDWQPEVITPVVDWESDDEAALDDPAWQEQDWDQPLPAEGPDGVEPQRWDAGPSEGSDVPGWVATPATDDPGWEQWAEEGDDALDEHEALEHEGWAPASPDEDGAGGRRISPGLGAGIVALVLFVLAVGLFGFDRLRGGDDGAGDEAAATTTSTTAATTTSSTASTTTTVVGTGPLTEVPNVVGLGLFEAAGVLEDAGFVSLPERRIDPFGQQGVVVEQDPSFGMIPQGSSVKIVFTEPEEPPADGGEAPFG